MSSKPLLTCHEVRMLYKVCCDALHNSINIARPHRAEAPWHSFQFCF